jgi:hypothetical protein
MFMVGVPSFFPEIRVCAVLLTVKFGLWDVLHSIQLGWGEAEDAERSLVRR